MERRKINIPWGPIHNTPEKIWNFSFISAIEPTVLPGAGNRSALRADLTNPSRERSFTKTLFKQEEFKTPAFTF